MIWGGSVIVRSVGGMGGKCKPELYLLSETFYLIYTYFVICYDIKIWGQEAGVKGGLGLTIVLVTRE